jgi:hypothetical protein
LQAGRADGTRDEKLDERRGFRVPRPYLGRRGNPT